MNHDPNMFGADYLHNGCNGRNGATVCNVYLWAKWSRDRQWHMTLEGQGHDPNISLGPISRKHLEMLFINNCYSLLFICYC